MSENEKNVPKRRFKEFENADDWEQRELGKLADVYDGTHQTPNYTDCGVMFLSVENIKTLQSEKFISEEDFEKDFAIFPKKGDVLMTRIGDIGTANVVESDAPKAYYVSLALLKQKELNPYFLKESISSKAVKKELWKRTLHIAFPKKINKNEIANVIVPYPVSEDEQQRIGELFRNFNNLITLHQRKLEKMKVLKKAYLTDMFPAEGERKPKLRFAGFTEDWEQRKLGDVSSKIGSGKTPLGGEKAYTDYGVCLIRSQNVNYGTVNLCDSVYIDDETDEEMKNSRVLNGDVLLNITGASIGRSAVYHSFERANVNQHVCIIRALSDEISPEFIHLNLTSNNGQKQIDSSQAGGAREGLNFQQISKMTFQFPKIEEQEQIGGFFNNLDNLITLHQRKLEKLQNIKKAYLNEMFI